MWFAVLANYKSQMEFRLILTRRKFGTMNRSITIFNLHTETGTEIVHWSEQNIIQEFNSWLKKLHVNSSKGPFHIKSTPPQLMRISEGLLHDEIF